MEKGNFINIIFKLMDAAVEIAYYIDQVFGLGTVNVFTMNFQHINKNLDEEGNGVFDW